MKWDLTPDLLFTFVVWPVFRELLWLALGWRLTLAAAVGLTQLLQFELSVFLLSSLLPWMTFHHGNFPFSSGLCWFLGRGCSLSHRSMHTELCGTVCLYVRVLSPCSSWKRLGQELWAPVLCWGCCRQVQAPVQLGRTDVLLLQCVLADWHGWCMVSSGQLLFLSFCIDSLLWCKPALFSEESAVQSLLALQDWLVFLSNWSSVSGFSLGHPFSSISHCHGSFLQCLPIFYCLSKLAQL